MSQWAPGKPLKGGKYIVDTLLGAGGFGVTYRAKEKASGKWVAIKTLNEKQRNKPNFAKIQEKFVNEALSLARCHHPNIVEVYQLFQEDELWCMVMEYVDGDNLADYLDERGVLPEKEAIRLIQQLGEALSCVHDKQLLHRDVKPLNIILRRESLSPVLIDFGLARGFISGRSQSMTSDRTERFAPIEQYDRRGEFGPYTDIYALAATLYNLVTEKLPLPADVRKEANTPLIPPQQYNSGISDRVNQAIMKGMALEPQDRPQSVAEWLALLAPPPFPKFNFEVVTVDKRGKITNRRRHEAQYFVEELGKGVSLEMVAIPGGSFLMGSPETKEGRRESESPQHRVTVAPFYMGKYPVTQAQWQAVAALPQVERPLEPDPSKFKGANRPVERVSWLDVVEFCKRLTRKSGREYRLPSEAEWEYACRAGTTTPFYFGETITPELANYNGNYTYGSGSKGIYREQTTDVGSFPPNAFGLYDMHGNIWEWCADPWHNNYQGAPLDGRVWDDNDNRSYFVLRGGSWYDDPRYCRSACRLNYDAADGRYFINGFRVGCAAARTKY